MASVASAMAEPYSSRRMWAKARLPSRGAAAAGGDAGAAASSAPAPSLLAGLAAPSSEAAGEESSMARV